LLLLLLLFIIIAIIIIYFHIALCFINFMHYICIDKEIDL